MPRCLAHRRALQRRWRALLHRGKPDRGPASEPLRPADARNGGRDELSRLAELDCRDGGAPLRARASASEPGGMSKDRRWYVPVLHGVLDDTRADERDTIRQAEEVAASLAA